MTTASLPARDALTRGAEGRFHIEKDAVRRYAAATDDPWPAHREGSAVPPLYSFVAASRCLAALMGEVIKGYTEGMVHIGQDLSFVTPMGCGDALDVVAHVAGVARNGMGSLWRLDTTISAGGTRRVDQSATLLARGMAVDDDGGSVPGLRGTRPPRQTPMLETAVNVGADQPARYAEASGDHMPIHVDREAARRFGYRDVVLHGMCTLALATHSILSLTGMPPHALRRLSARFGAPVFPLDKLTVRVWALAGGSAAFEVRNPKEQSVLRFGHVDFGNA